MDRIALITQLAEPLAASLGLALWGVECVGAGRPVLRIFVERATRKESASADGSQEGDARDAGVNIDDCAELSRLLGASLDVENPFSAAWTLEVSTPGLERTFFYLEQLEGYAGRELDVVLSEAHPTWPVAEGMPGRKKFRGHLEHVGNDGFTLAVPVEIRTPDAPERVEIAWKTVRRVRLVHDFPEPGLPGKGGRAAKKAPKSGGNA